MTMPAVLLARRLDAVDQRALVVALGELDRHAPGDRLRRGTPARRRPGSRGRRSSGCRLPSMLRLGRCSTSTGLAAGGRRAAFAAKSASRISEVAGRYSMATSRHKAGVRRPAANRVSACANSRLASVHRSCVFPPPPAPRRDALVASASGTMRGMHGTAAGAQPERGAAAVAAVGRPLDQAALHQAGDRPADRHLSMTMR